MQRRDEALENVQKALEEQSEAMRRGGAMALDGNGSSQREIYAMDHSMDWFKGKSTGNHRFYH